MRNADLAADMRVRTRYPALAQALLAGASGQLRNLATTGGNLLQRTRCAYFRETSLPCNKREPGTGCAALDGYTRYHAVLGASEHCVATHPSDMAVALLAFDAVVQVSGPDGGAREMALADLHRLPGDAPERDTTLRHGELITAVDLPALPIAARSAYRKVRDRASFAFALVSVATALELDDDGETIADVRIAFGGLAHAPWRASRAEDAAARRAGDRDRLPRRRPRRAGRRPAAARQRVQGADGDGRPRGDAARPHRRSRGGGAAMSPVSDAVAARSIGADIGRLDGPQKVTGAAPYAYEHPLTDPAYVFALLSTVARGTVTRIDADRGSPLPGVLASSPTSTPPPLADTSDDETRDPAVPRDPLPRTGRRRDRRREPRDRRRGGRARALIDQQAADHRVLLSPDDPELFAADESCERCRPAGDVEAALRAAAASRRGDLQHADGAQQPDGAAHDGGPLARRDAAPVRVHAERPRRARLDRRASSACEAEHVHVTRAVRRRRLRLQGHGPRADGARRHGGPGRARPAA